MRYTDPVIKRRKILLIIAGGLLFIGLIMFLLRGWIRNSFIPSYVDKVYRPQITKQFDKDFNPVNKIIKDSYGIELADGGYSQNLCGLVVNYEGFGESVMCYRSADIKPITADSAFITRWKLISPHLETDLLADGWTKEWNAQQPIDEILDSPQNNGSIGVNYSKSHGKTSCILTFMWIQPHEPNQLEVREVCERDVAFFGGY